MGEYWLERERELIKRHNQIIQRRKELLEETIRHTIDARHVREQPALNIPNLTQLS